MPMTQRARDLKALNLALHQAWSDSMYECRDGVLSYAYVERIDRLRERVRARLGAGYVEYVNAFPGQHVGPTDAQVIAQLDGHRFAPNDTFFHMHGR
jgi:hypothetical protein